MDERRRREEDLNKQKENEKFFFHVAVLGEMHMSHVERNNHNSLTAEDENEIEVECESCVISAAYWKCRISIASVFCGFSVVAVSKA